MIFTGQSTTIMCKNVRSFFNQLILLVVFLLLSFISPKNTHALEKKNQISSLYNFQADFRRYPKELWALAKQIQKDQTPSSLNNSLRAIDTYLKKGRRGLQDELYELKAFVYEKLARNDDALLSYQKSLELRADNSLALYRHALILVSKNSCEKATPELRELLWSNKANEHEINYLFAVCQLKIDKEKSISLFEKSYFKNADFQPTIEQLLSLYSEEYEKNLATGIESSGLSQKMFPLIDKLIGQNPENQEYKKKFIKLTTIHKDPFIDQEQFNQAVNYARQIVIKDQFQSVENVLVYFDLLVKIRSLDLAQKLITNAENKNPKLSKSLAGAKKQLAIETIQ